MGCQSQVKTVDGQQQVSKSCQNIVDCYVDSADRLASGQCDPSNPNHSNCIYCCEDEYCNYDDHFESSFYLVLKMANFRRSQITLKTGLQGRKKQLSNSKLDREAVAEMYATYKGNRENFDRQLRKKGAKGLRKLVDIALR